MVPGQIPPSINASAAARGNAAELGFFKTCFQWNIMSVPTLFSLAVAAAASCCTRGVIVTHGTLRFYLPKTLLYVLLDRISLLDIEEGYIYLSSPLLPEQTRSSRRYSMLVALEQRCPTWIADRFNNRFWSLDRLLCWASGSTTVHNRPETDDPSSFGSSDKSDGFLDLAYRYASSNSSYLPRQCQQASLCDCGPTNHVQ